MLRLAPLGAAAAVALRMHPAAERCHRLLALLRARARAPSRDHAFRAAMAARRGADGFCAHELARLQCQSCAGLQRGVGRRSSLSESLGSGRISASACVLVRRARRWSYVLRLYTKHALFRAPSVCRSKRW